MQFLRRDRTETAQASGLFCSSEVFLELVKGFAHNNNHWKWQEYARSVFVHGGYDPAHLVTLVRILTNNDTIAVNESDGTASNFFVAEDPELCGAMAGVRIAAFGLNRAPVVVSSGNSGIRDLVSNEHGAIFLKIQYRDVPIFVSTPRQIIDLDARLTTGVFDIRDYTPAALPIVLYIKWAFSSICWQPAERNACVVIDDPLLSRKYGFLNFDKLLLLMRQHGFTTNIAFIPWNWSRSEPQIARLFAENQDVYSLSIHGCDHTRAEFAIANRERLYSKAEKALERMANHELKTGIPFNRVMVFPQGLFSEAALSALKHADFIASVNNHTVSADPHPRVITVRDVWDAAVLSYGSFPLFTRRHPWEGLENFAFDILLGKPALIGIHHDYCVNGCGDLVDFVERLNALKCCLTWRSLGEAVKRSYWRREPLPGVVEVKMYGTELLIENRSHDPKRFIINKSERNSSLIDAIRAGSDPLEWRFSNDRIQFETNLKPGASATVRIHFHVLKAEDRGNETIAYRLRTMLRRCASEMRDNYVMTNKLVLSTRLHDVFAADSELMPRGGLISGNGVHGRNASHDSATRMRFISQRAADRLGGEVSRILADFTQWLSRYGEASWDHQSFFAGPVGGRAKELYYRNRLLGTAAVAPMIFCEAFFPPARRLFHHPIRFPIADAHYAMGFATLFETTGHAAHFQRATHFLNELKASRCPNFEEYCWGYPFNWVTRNGTIPKQTPLITTTPYVYEAFLQAHEIEPRDEWKRILESIARHAHNDIRDFKTSETASSCAYTPFDQTGGVINAAAYRAFLLTSASHVFSNDDYWKTAERNLNFVLEAQQPDGSWPYAVDVVRDFVDHYHTCFVMKALAKIHRLTGHEETIAALKKGIGYYLENLFDKRGFPRPFAKAPRRIVYRRELYDFAECINVCVLLRDSFPELESVLQNVISRLLEDWIKSDGSFRSRRLHLGWDNVPMHRWGQSQMFRSLALYLEESSRRRGQGSEVRGQLSAVPR